MSTAVVEDDLFEMTINASGFTAEDLDKKGGGGAVDKEGHYHVLMCRPVQEKGDGKVPSIRVDMKILAGTDDTQVGKMVFHRAYLARKGENGTLEELSEGSKLNLLKFFANLGLVSKEAVAGSEKVGLPWLKLEFFQAIVEVKNEPFDETDRQTGMKTGKKRDSFRIPYGCNVWQVSDEKVAYVPKDPDALAEFTGGAGIDDVSDI